MIIMIDMANSIVFYSFLSVRKKFSCIVRYLVLLGILHCDIPLITARRGHRPLHYTVNLLKKQVVLQNSPNLMSFHKM